MQSRTFTPVTESVAAAARLAPESDAVVFRDERLSHRALLRLAAGVARALRAHGAGPEELVAVCLPRSARMVPALLGVLQAGAAYLPVALDGPPERARQLLAEAGVRLALVSGSAGLPDRDGWAGVTLVDVDAVEPADPLPGEPPLGAPGPDDLAYTLYTSGSTGRPKGVAMEHRALANLIAHQTASSAAHHGGRPMRTLQYTPLTFDVSFLDIFATLASGGTVVVPDEADRRDPRALLSLLTRERITSLFLPLVALQQLADEAVRGGADTGCLREVMTGGEQLVITPGIADWWRRMPDCVLRNIYGPTEAHVVTAHELSGDPDGWPVLAPIGAAVPGADIRLLGPDGAPVPAGEPGELWIAGVCLARGYLGQPELTAERFVATDFGRAYRTGDLAVELPDGGYQFIGRTDDQTKIQGVRVEPAEIEAVLARHPDVAACAVLASRAPSGARRLVGYVLPRDPGPDGRPLREDGAHWREHLLAELPEAMVPAVWMRLSALPLTSSGKVDRNALPPVSRERPALAVTLVPPRSRTERLVAAVWQDALDLETLGVDDGFFDLGGTSLLATEVVARLREATRGPVGLVQIFEHPTVRSLARALDDAASEPETGMGIGTGARTGAGAGAGSGPRAGTAGDRIAIVGMACRFPGAADPGQLWANLHAGTESITRFERGADDDPDFVPAASTLPGIELLDAGLFGFSPREAAQLDPQHRLFLECSWEALEDAAVDPRAFPGRIGVFGGTGPSTYLINNVHPAQGWRPDRNFIDSAADVTLLLANDKDFLTSRVAYTLDLRGPGVNLNAACATSLFAVHYAARALLAGDADLVLAGAACVPVPQLSGHLRQPGMPFSPDGHCRAFDERAEGTVFGSGVAVVALKRLSDALADGDDVYAVLLGSAVNNDGAAKVGMAAPSSDGQARAIADALAGAGVPARTVRYVEAHGTATPVGDPIEVSALRQVFGEGDPGRCALGSVKTNLGHLGWAAGMAGLMKAVLALRHRVIPPTLHFQRPNPELRLEAGPFYVNTEPVPFPAEPGTPRRAGVSAFGLGGSNAHLVLEEAPPRTDPADPADPAATGPYLLPLTARTPAALAALAARHRDALTADPGLELADVARTLRTGRTRLEVRRALPAADRDAAVAGLDRLARSAGAGTGAAAGTGPGDGRVVGLFTGHGAEYLGMGRGLYRRSPAFRAALDSLDELAAPHLGASLADTLYGPSVEPGAPVTGVREAHILIYTTQLALARFWESVGVRFDAVVGHSLGEFAAACVAGVFRPEDGFRLILARAELMLAMPEDGGMAAVLADERTVRAACQRVGADLDVAVVNSPSNTVLSGAREEVRRVGAALAELGLPVKPLRTLRAGHSRMMEPLVAGFTAAAAGVELRRPGIDFLSNLTGGSAADQVCRPEYWGDQLRRTVRFADALRAAAELGAGAFIEVGPSPTLLGIAQEVLADHPARWLPTLDRKQDDLVTVSTGLAALWEAGYEVDLAALAPAPGRPAHLPGYPFQRERHWVDAPAGGAARAAEPHWSELQHELRWREVQPQGPEPVAPGWLVVDPDDTGLAARLRAHGLDALPADRARLADLLTAHPGFGVLHLAPGTPDPDPDGDGGDALDAVRPGLSGALAVAQAAAERGAPLCLVSRAAQAVAPGDPVTPAQAPVWGLGRVVQVEHPDLGCRLVDLPDRPLDDEAGPLARLLGSGSPERELALRQSGWFAPRIVRAPQAHGAPRLRADAVYLVVGGLTGLGLWAARRLAARGARQLVLAGRRAPSAQAEAVLAELRAGGVTVTAAALDVTDADRLGDLLDGLTAPLAGVLYCAGALDDTLLAGLDWERCEAVLSAKVRGAWLLHRATLARGTDLDWFVLYSSATSVLGNFGQANYASANAFLDALAWHRRALGLPALSVNWGAWTGVGELANRPELLAQVLRRGMGRFSADAGAAILEQSLAGPGAQLCVLPNDWPVFLERHNLSAAPKFAELLADARTGAATTPPATGPGPAELVAAAGPQERPALLTAQVTAVIAEVLGISGEQVGADSPFAGVGVDSLSAIQIRNELQRRLACALPPRVLFSCPTVEALAGHLDTLLDAAWADRVLAAAGPTGAAGAPEPPVGAPADVPLTVQQRRWLSLVREVGYGQRAVPAIFHSPLDPAAFRRALRAVVGRHELLRYRYPDGAVELLGVDQVLPADDELFADYRELSEADRAQAVAAEVERCYAGMPDPYRRPSWTIRCAALTDDRFLVLIGAQHLEFDGSALSSFLAELRELYLGGTLPDRPAQYREYAEYQRRYLAGPVETDRAYFSGLFAGVDRTTALPGHPGFERTSAHPSQRLSAPLAPWKRVLAAADALGSSPFALLLASYARLVGEVSGSADPVIAVIRSGRSQADWSSAMGPFTAPFPLPVRLAGRDDARLAGQCQLLVEAMTARADYPSTDLIAVAPAFAGFPEDTYFTDTTINFLNYRRTEREGSLAVEVPEILGEVRHRDLVAADFGSLRRIPGLHLVADVTGESLTGNYWFHSGRFTSATVAGWADRHRRFLTTLLDEFAPEAADD